MTDKTKNQKRVSITKLITFIMYAFIIGIIGVSLPKTINFINGFSETAFYGNFVSYIVSALLFWIFTKNFNFMTNRESHFKKKTKK